MYCRCINNERIDKAFIIGNLYQYIVNDKDWVTVYEPYQQMYLGFIQPHLIPMKDFVLSFQTID